MPSSVQISPKERFTKEVNEEIKAGKDIESVLAEQVAKVNSFEDACALLSLAVQHKSKTTIQNLTTTRLGDSSIDGSNFFHYAMAQGDLDMVKTLWEHYYPKNKHSTIYQFRVMNKEKHIPLSACPESKRADMVKFLSIACVEDFFTDYLKQNMKGEWKDCQALKTINEEFNKILAKHKQALTVDCYYELVAVVNSVKLDEDDTKRSSEENKIFNLVKVLSSMRPLFDEYYADLECEINQDIISFNRIRSITQGASYRDDDHDNIVLIMNQLLPNDRHHTTGEKMQLFQELLSKVTDSSKLYNRKPFSHTIVNRFPEQYVNIFLRLSNCSSHVDLAQNTILHNITNRPDKLKTVLKAYPDINVNAQNDKGETPLHLACKNRNSKAILMLYLHGAKLDIENKDKQKAEDLLRSDDKHSKNTLELIKQHQGDKENNNLLHLLFDSDLNQNFFIDNLVYLGVDPTMKNKAGKTPLEICKNLSQRFDAAKSVFSATIRTNMCDELKQAEIQYDMNGDLKTSMFINDTQRQLKGFSEAIGGSNSAVTLAQYHLRLIEYLQDQMRKPQAQQTDVRKVLFGVLSVLLSLFIVTNVLWAFSGVRNTMWNTSIGYNLYQKSLAAKQSYQELIKPCIQ